MPRTTILLFTRSPMPGRTKTRLIPSLGPEGAAELQRRMTRTISGMVSAYSLARAIKFVVVFEGSNRREMAEWLGPGNYIRQSPGDLGAKLAAAVRREFSLDTSKLLVIGADCPRLSPTHLTAALDALDTTDLVFGPATDGGFYLIGLRSLCPQVFIDIPWGGNEVLRRSLRAAEDAGKLISLIETLPDVDEAADLADAEIALQKRSEISVIIPAKNEEENLSKLLPFLRASGRHQVFVADGGSTDRTIEIAIRYDAKVLTGAKGRAAQMNAAARVATGEFLLFLHADTTPPANWADSIPDHLNRIGTVAGAFGFSLREPIPFGSLIEKLVALRCRFFSLPYGDQGIFVRRSLFERIGEFPDWPLLEDLELIKQLARLGRIKITPEKASTSARRWSEKGVIRIFLLHQFILVGHLIGISPVRLATLRKRFG